MKKRARGGTQAETGATEDIEAVVRASAQSIAERLGSSYPAFDDLAEDAEFLETSQRLAETDVPFETVARLERASTPIVAAMAHRAAWLRDDVPAGWSLWALRRLKSVYAGEVLFLLRAIERHGEPPFIARVLSRADHDWTEGWLLSVVTAFIERRVEAGERPTVTDFEQAVREPDEELVAEVVAALEGVLPPETVREFEQWREATRSGRLLQIVRPDLGTADPGRADHRRRTCVGRRRASGGASAAGRAVRARGR